MSNHLFTNEIAVSLVRKSHALNVGRYLADIDKMSSNRRFLSLQFTNGKHQSKIKHSSLGVLIKNPISIGFDQEYAEIRSSRTTSVAIDVKTAKGKK